MFWFNRKPTRPRLSQAELDALLSRRRNAFFEEQQRWIEAYRITTEAAKRTPRPCRS